MRRAGLIAAVGSDVKKWSLGDRVTFDSTVYCGECWFCRRGQINLCDERRVLGVSCDDYRRNGTFAEQVAVPERILYRIPESVSFDQATMVEPVSIALHAVARTKITLGDTAVVVGSGRIGLLVVQALRAAGCGQIMACELDPQKLELACQLGADAGLQSDQVDVTEEVFRRTDGRGADVAIEAVGITPTIQTAVGALRKGGQLTLVGNLTAQVEMPLQAIVTRELTLNGTCASSGEYPACLEMIERGAIRVDPLMSETAPLEEGAAWFERLYEGQPGLMKVILNP